MLSSSERAKLSLEPNLNKLGMLPSNLCFNSRPCTGRLAPLNVKLYIKSHSPASLSGTSWKNNPCWHQPQKPSLSSFSAWRSILNYQTYTFLAFLKILNISLKSPIVLWSIVTPLCLSTNYVPFLSCPRPWKCGIQWCIITMSVPIKSLSNC